MTPSVYKRSVGVALRQVVCGVALLGALAGCAPLVVGGAVGTALVLTDRRTSGAQLEDQNIELRANNVLSAQFGDRARLVVTSFNRRVLLTGDVPSAQDKATAARLVSQVENVQQIVDELAVQAPASLSQRSSDTLVTAKVKASFVDARDLVSSAFKVVTEKGTVYLMGRVTQREADRATEVTRGVSGVQRVVRVFEVISEEELKRIQPPPAKAGDAPAQPAR
jgi:osmotically-inducible protein OsmY